MQSLYSNCVIIFSVMYTVLLNTQNHSYW